MFTLYWIVGIVVTSIGFLCTVVYQAYNKSRDEYDYEDWCFCILSIGIGVLWPLALIVGVLYSTGVLIFNYLVFLFKKYDIKILKKEA